MNLNIWLGSGIKVCGVNFTSDWIEEQAVEAVLSPHGVLKTSMSCAGRYVLEISPCGRDDSLRIMSLRDLPSGKREASEGYLSAYITRELTFERSLPAVGMTGKKTLDQDAKLRIALVKAFTISHLWG